MTDKPHARPYLELASDEKQSMMEQLGVTQEELEELLGEDRPHTRGDEFIDRDDDDATQTKT